MYVCVCLKEVNINMRYIRKNIKCLKIEIKNIIMVK